MAELPTLGFQCQHKDCKQLDFLPIVCSHCDLTFCKLHHPFTLHLCTRVDNILPEGDIATVPGYECEFGTCQKREPVKLICTKCHVHFCLSHRHADQHNCPSLPDTEHLNNKWEAPKEKFQEAKKNIDKMLTNKLRTAKNKERASKIQLMRLKSQASLSKQRLNIPSSERVHFLIKYGQSDSVVVVSSSWSLGRIIDAAADQCKAANSNNVPGAPKLRLFQDDRSAIDVPLDELLTNLLSQGILIDGQTLILDYV